MTEEVMDTDNQQPETDANNKLLGVTNTENVITVALHGVTNLNAMEHSYSHHLEEPMPTQPDYYATTEHKDDAIDSLLRLSATDTSVIEFPGDNGQLMPIAPEVCESGDMLLDTAEVTAAIETIALEETIEKTTSTVSTQTTFTRQRHQKHVVDTSDTDSDDNESRKPLTRSQSRNKTKSKKMEFTTVKYGLKK